MINPLKQANLVCKVIIVSFVMVCNSQNKKPTACGTEKEAIMRLSRLSEVEEQQHYIDSVSKRTKGVSYIVDENNTDSYRIRAGYNGKFHWDTYFIFHIDKKNCENIHVEDVQSGDILTLKQWRTRNIIYKISYKINDPDGYTNLRKEKNKQSAILQKINTGEKIEVLDNSSDWFLVKTKSGNEGYVHKSKIKSE